MPCEFCLPSDHAAWFNGCLFLRSCSVEGKCGAYFCTRGRGVLRLLLPAGSCSLCGEVCPTGALTVSRALWPQLSGRKGSLGVDCELAVHVVGEAAPFQTASKGPAVSFAKGSPSQPVRDRATAHGMLGPARASQAHKHFCMVRGSQQTLIRVLLGHPTSKGKGQNSGSLAWLHRTTSPLYLAGFMGLEC